MMASRYRRHEKKAGEAIRRGRPQPFPSLAGLEAAHRRLERVRQRARTRHSEARHPLLHPADPRL